MWDNLNDGSGSGLDADTVDGLNVHTGTNNVANQIVRTNASGYIDAGWINTTSGNNTTQIRTRFYGSDDAYLRYYDRSYMQNHLGLSGKTSFVPRSSSNSSEYYRTGSQGWGGNNLNDFYNRGSCFVDVWTANLTGAPPGSHWNGFQALHYSASNTYHHGMRLLMNAGNPATTYLQGWWANGGSGYSAQKIWTDGNDGSGSGLDADLLDGLNSTVFVGTHDGTNRAVQAEVGALHFYGDGLNSGQSALSYAIFQEAGAWSSPFPDLRIAYHTGIKLGGHYSYGGTRFYNNSDMVTELFSVGNGDNHIRATSNIYAYTSDKRLKENFRPIENAVDKVKAIGGYLFDWREDMISKYEFEPDSRKDDAGVIAQDVQKVLPAAVQRAPFDYDQWKPNQSKSGEEFLTVQYEKIVPLLIEAIKEQQDQIDELKKLLENK